MADQRLTDKGSLSSFDDNDLIHVVDVSDTTSSAEGTSKKGLWSLFKSTLKTYFDTIYNEKQNIFIVNSEEDIDTLISAGDVGIWIINSDITMTGNITIPAGVELRFNDVKINLNSNTLGFNSTTITSKFQCFEGSGSFSGTLNNNINAEWFGAAKDGSTDDTAALNSALEMADDLGGHTVELLNGEYYIDSRKPTKDYLLEVYSNTSLIGQGMYASTLKVGDNVGKDTPLILTNSASNLVFSDFEIDGNKTRMVQGDRGTGEDEGIDIKGGTNITITRVYIHDCATDGIDIDQVSNIGSYMFISDCIIQDNGGVGIHSGWDYTTTSNTLIVNNGHDRLANATGQVSADAAGIDIGGDFSRIVNCTIEDNARGINLFAFQKPIVANNTLVNNGDVNINVGANITDTSGPVDAIIIGNTMLSTEFGMYVRKSNSTLNITGNFIRSEVSGGGGYAIYVNDSQGFNVSNTVMTSQSYGIHVEQVTGVSKIINCDFSGCISSGARVAPNASGYVIISGCIDDASTGVGAVDLRGLVNGCTIKNNDFTNRIGIKMTNTGSGNPSNIVIKDNETTGMTIAGSGHTIKRNTGYITEAYGTDTIADTNSTVVVSHGLDITPTKISLTSAGNELIWYSTITSTQFTVNRSGTSGALDFSWEAE